MRISEHGNESLVSQFLEQLSNSQLPNIELSSECSSLHRIGFEVLTAVVMKSRDSVVGIATGYGLDGRGVGVRVPEGSRIFTSPRCPDRHLGPPNLSNGYRGLFPRG
jgi:hypothetical protein